MNNVGNKFMMLSKKILVNLESTPSCPAACSMCPRSLVKESGFMKLETMEKIVDQLDKSFVWEVDLAGRGEPTIHPELPALLEIMRRPGIPTGIVTTGVTLTQKNVDAIVKNVDLIRLSVSSIDKSTFEKVHIGLDYEKIWRNIVTLSECAAHKTVIHLTGGPSIYEHLPETVTYLRKLGFSRLHLFPLWNRGGSLIDNLDATRRKQLMINLDLNSAESEYSTGIGKVKFFTNLLLGKMQNEKYCYVGDSSVSISYEGKILGCFQDFGHTSNLGHINQNLIKDVLKQRLNKLGKMAICKGCNANKVSLMSR